jgi:hypothetical protein
MKVSHFDEPDKATVSSNFVSSDGAKNVVFPEKTVGGNNPNCKTCKFPEGM